MKAIQPGIRYLARPTTEPSYRCFYEGVGTVVGKAATVDRPIVVELFKA